MPRWSWGHPLEDALQLTLRVRMEPFVGVQEPILRYPLSIAKSSCASCSLGEVASSSGVQQAQEQKCSAGRQLGGGDDDFDY